MYLFPGGLGWESVLHVYSIIMKIRKLTVIHYYYLKIVFIFLLNCPNIVFKEKKKPDRNVIKDYMLCVVVMS